MKNSEKKLRKIILWLFISGILNISLGVLFFYYVIKDRPPTPYFELRPATKESQEKPLAIDQGNQDVIRYFQKMPKEWLVARLSNDQQVENGYTQRDLALASLVAFHYFDLDRALAGLPQVQQKRKIVYGKYKDGNPAELIVFPGLSDKHFEAASHFATTERWPLTSKGLFLTLQKGSPSQSLYETFYMTPEFQSVEVLFNRAETKVERSEIASMLMEGSWSSLNSFYEQQKASQDLSLARRQRFLLDYTLKRSKTAAYLLLKLDPELASKKLDNTQVLAILQLLDEKKPEAEQFALSVLTGPRSDDVWKAAAIRLYSYANEPFPEKYSYNDAINRFAPKTKKGSNVENVQVSAAVPPPVPKPSSPPPVAVSKPRTNQPPQPTKNKAIAEAPLPVKKPIIQSRPERVYVVQEGDSLWKIARRFNVDVDHLKSINKIDKETLRPGMPLRIP